MGSKLEGILSIATLPTIGIVGFLVLAIIDKLNKKDTK